jgi:hypothetical protein
VIDTLKERTKRISSTDFPAVLALFFTSLFFFYDLFGGRYLLTERDLGLYFIPPRFFWVESIKHGSFPLWNPFQFSGQPFFGNPQHGMLYPLNIVFFFLPFDIAFNAVIILHFFLGGLFTYLFLRDLKVNSAGALISGLIFMLSGYLLSVHSLLTILLSSIWTPLIMMFFRRAILSHGFKNEIFTAIFITMSFLGGGLEIVYGNFFVLFIMMVFYPFPWPNVLGKKWICLDGHSGFDQACPVHDTGESSISKLDSRLRGNDGIGTDFLEDKPRRNKSVLSVPISKLFGSVPIYWGRIRSLLMVSLLFLSLSAVQLFPFLELLHRSIRGNGISYLEATTWSFAPKDILLFFLPDAYGYFLDMKKYWVAQCWFKTLYIGGLPFILSSIFFIFGKNRKFYIVLMFFSLFLALGKYNPLYTFVFKYAPFFSGIRYPAKFLYIFILVLSITAGLGFQKLSEYSKDNEKRRLKHLLIIFSLISGFLLLFSVFGHKEVEHFLKLNGIDIPDFNPISVNLHHAQRFLFYLALFFLLLRVGYEVKWKTWTKVLLIVFLTADLFGNMGYYRIEKTLGYFQKTKILETVSSDKDTFRVFSTAKTISPDTTILIGDPSFLNTLKEKHYPSMNLLCRLHDVWGVDVIRVKRADDLYKVFVSSSSISSTQLIDLYGVKYVTSVTPLEKNHKFELIYANLEGLEGKKEDLLKENTIKLYKNRNPLPRAWLVKDYQVMDSNKMLSMMTQKRFDPRKEVLLEETPSSFTLLNRGGGASRGEAEIISESNNRLALRVGAPEDSLLVLSDTYYPGWKAFVDGKKTKIYRADYTFRAIPFSAGAHRVEFVYDPLSFKLGALFTMLGIIGCAVIYLRGKNR